jgi:predicted RNase H-like HicB family nuclease
MKKSNAVKKDLNYYLSYPYKFEIMQHSDGRYSSRVVGISCYSGGDTAEEALSQIKEALQFYIESCLEDNLDPLPISEDEATGRAQIRIAKRTHLKLLELSKEEGVSVSHLINDAIVRTYG